MIAGMDALLLRTPRIISQAASLSAPSFERQGSSLAMERTAPTECGHSNAYTRCYPSAACIAHVGRTDSLGIVLCQRSRHEWSRILGFGINVVGIASVVIFALVEGFKDVLRDFWDDNVLDRLLEE